MFSRGARRKRDLVRALHQAALDHQAGKHNVMYEVTVTREVQGYAELQAAISEARSTPGFLRYDVLSLALPETPSRLRW